MRTFAKNFEALAGIMKAPAEGRKYLGDFLVGFVVNDLRITAHFYDATVWAENIHTGNIFVSAPVTSGMTMVKAFDDINEMTSTLARQNGAEPR